MITTMMDLERYRKAGFVCVASFFTAETLAEVRRWVDDLEARPGSFGLLQHDEMTASGRRRARTENFAPYHAGLRRLLTEGPIVEMAGELLGEPAVLFKEKINYKHPGGAGFAAHQDQVAYPQIARSVTCLLAVDAARAANGCLEFVAGGHDVLLTPDSDGCIPRDVAAALGWTAMPVEAGSLVWFHGLAPHRSGPNRTSRSRRAIYATYNARSEGDVRAAYYADKQRILKAAVSGTRERISLIGHFQGRPAPRSEDEG